MDANDERKVRDELRLRMDGFLGWIDLHFKHEFTPTFANWHMADAAMSVLKAAWEAYAEGREA